MGKGLGYGVCKVDVYLLEETESCSLSYEGEGEGVSG